MKVKKNQNSYHIARRVGCQAGNDKYTTEKYTMNLRSRFRIGTWNVRKKIQTPPTPLRFDFTTMNENYRVETSNRFAALLEYKDDKTPNELWEKGKEIFLTSAKNIARRKKNNNPWISEKTLLEIDINDE